MHPWNDLPPVIPLVPDDAPPTPPVHVGRIFRLPPTPRLAQPEERAGPDHGPGRTPIGLVFERHFPSPGVCVRVPFGPFASVLWEQLADPRQARATDRFDCLVQVYHVHEPLTIALLVQAEALAGPHAQPRILTHARGEALGLTALLDQLPDTAPAETPPVVEPGQVLCSMLLLADPTHREPLTSPPEDPIESPNGTERATPPPLR